MKLAVTRYVVAACFTFLLASCGGGETGTTTAAKAKPTEAEALASFEIVRSVLQHPRCQNCHPAGDAPLQGDEGAVHTQNVQRGPKGEGAISAECTTCHGPANPPSSYGIHIPPGVVKGWHMPPPEMKMVFVGMSPKALCEQVKDPARNGHKDGAALDKHLDDELVVWGWAPGFGRAPVPIPHERYKTAWRTWWNGGAPCPAK